MPTTPKTCAGVSGAIRSGIDMVVTSSGVVQGWVVSNQATRIEGVVMVDGLTTLPEGMSGGPGVLTAAQLGGVFLAGPLIKRGVERRRGNVPSAICAQMGRMFKEQNREVYVDKSQQRIRVATSQDPRVRKHYTKLATVEEKLCKQDTRK